MVKRIDYSKVGIKTIAIILFCLALLFSALIAITGAGKVQAANPTVITTPQELNNIRHDMEGDYVLGNNINLNVAPYNTGAGWDPIGDRYDLGNFKGTFDGKGFTISGLMVDRPSSYGGLFGLTSGTSKFSNVKIVDVNIKTGHAVGALLGEIGNGGLIENVHVTGTLSGADNVGGVAGSLTNAKIKNSSANVNITSTSRAGGLIGYSGGDAAIIENSTSAGTIMSTGSGIGGLTGTGSTVINSSSSVKVTSTHNGDSSNVGGLVGLQSVFRGEITNSFATGAVAASNGGNVGGLIGYLVASTTSPVTNSYATGTVTGLKNVGGLVGQNNGITISDSYATGKVFGEDDVGGLIGYHHNNALVERSYSESTVMATGDNVGGLIGSTKDAPKVIDTYARGNVGGNDNVGGLVGFNPAATIHRSYATGKVTGASNEGGLVGNDVHGKFSPQAPNFYDSQATEQFDSTGGTGLLTSVMMDIENKTSTYTNWNFTSVWDMEPNDYPILTPFGDINNHWGKAQIKEAAKRGLITGYEDRTFKPDNSITRAQFIVILDRAIENMDGDKSAPAFKDSGQIGDWAKDAIDRAVRAGILDGYTDGTFKPNKEISREEIAKLISVAFELQRTTSGSSGFSDDNQIQDWAKEYVAILKDHKIVTGKGGNKFAPKEKTKRVEGAVMLLRVLE